MKYSDYFKEDLEAVHKKLEELLPKQELYPQVLHEAMHYAVFSGGKRFRPIITLSAAEALGGDKEQALIPAVALEFIHCYSLVQDDLPALDNDDMRRGKPTSHKKFGENIAILASDGLLTSAFEILALAKPAEKAVKLVREISTCAGSCGMIGGQVADLIQDQGKLDLAMLDYISIHKTGKLIKASAVSGAIAADADEDSLRRIERYGEFLGLAFQTVDDLLDGDGYLRHMKAKQVEENVRDLIAKAKKEIKPFGHVADKLLFLADFLIERIPEKVSL